MKEILRWPVVFILTLAVSAVAAVPVFSLGLIVHEAVSNILTILVTGLLAALAASWLTNLFRIGSAWSRLLSIVAICEIAAAVLAIVYMGITLSPAAPVLRSLFPVNMLLLVTWGAFLSAVACLAAWRLRRPAQNLKRDAVISLVLLGLTVAVIVAAIAIASLFGLTGA